MALNLAPAAAQRQAISKPKHRASVQPAARTAHIVQCTAEPSRHAAPQQLHTPAQQHTSRRAWLAGVAAGLTAATAASSASATEAFLTSTGAKGPLAEEEERLFQLRREKEGEARRQLQAERELLEQEGMRTQMGKLCATPFGIDIVGITEAVALVGALVGGITSRQRKAEVEKLNEQLRKINVSLRQQARSGTVYAPGLTYAPPTPSSAPTFPGFDDPLLSDLQGYSPPAAATATLPRPPSPAATIVAAPLSNNVILPASSIYSMEEEEQSPDQIQCREALRHGKRLLKEQNGASAMLRFEKALMLSKAVGDQVQERRAMRGLAAAARLQGQFKTAIRHLQRVLEISKEMQEYTGDADAYGVIADCYTDLGEFEKAAEYYDKYLDRMNREGPV